MTFVAAFAWLIASNHCAFAALTHVEKSGHACCHEGEPAKPAPSTQCCEAFNVPIPEHAAAPSAQLGELKPAWIDAAEIFVRQPRVAASAGSDTGPPCAAPALQIILSRCMPAHAPPLFVA
jgi:hypothetical protein